MRALSKTEKTKLNRGRERWNKRDEQPFKEFREAEYRGRNQPQQVDLNPNANEPGMNQPKPGETKGSAVETDMLLM